MTEAVLRDGFAPNEYNPNLKVSFKVEAGDAVAAPDEGSL